MQSWGKAKLLYAFFDVISGLHVDQNGFIVSLILFSKCNTFSIYVLNDINRTTLPHLIDLTSYKSELEGGEVTPLLKNNSV